MSFEHQVLSLWSTAISPTYLTLIAVGDKRAEKQPPTTDVVDAAQVNLCLPQDALNLNKVT